MMNDISIKSELLILEPFYGGSHKVLIDIIVGALEKKLIPFDLLTLPAKKWHWKARTSAFSLFSSINSSKNYKTLFCSSVLNLCELLGLCTQLSKCKKVVYFHENQLEYPVQNKKDRDFQYGYNQILTALVADVVVFNSSYNMESFLSKIDSFLKLMPGGKPKNLPNRIRSKCEVLYFPIEKMPPASFYQKNYLPCDDVLQIAWTHRWEHDKDPATFFNILYQMMDNNLQFQVCVLGEHYSEIPSVFNEAKEKLGTDHIKHWGFLPDKQSYFELLSSCDVVVSTALHEFFGVSMVEAVSLGCFPLCPNRLSYPEIFPSSCLYNTSQQLYKKLQQYSKNRTLVKKHYSEANFDLDRFAWTNLKSTYMSLLSTS